MRMMRLRDSGAFDQTQTEMPAETPSFLDKRARFVYAGKFMSMDGPVEVTPEHLQKLVKKYNSRLSKLTRMANGKVTLTSNPPVQLDHNRSARDTIGRLHGELTIEDFELEDGVKVPAVYGQLRVLGRENVEKVLDGRWSELSIGADFEEGKISELSVTPFPAAEGASLLAKKSIRLGMNSTSYSFTHKGRKWEIWQRDSSDSYLAESNKGEQVYFTCRDSKESAIINAAKSAINDDYRLGLERLSNQGEHMKFKALEARLRRFFKLKKKLSDEETEEKMKKLEEEDDDDELKKLADEMDEDEKKMSEEEDKKKEEKLAKGSKVKTESHKGHKIEIYRSGQGDFSYVISDSEGEVDSGDGWSTEAEAIQRAKSSIDKHTRNLSEEDDKEKKLTAARASITKLSTDFRAKTKAANLRAKATSIGYRLSALRSSGKITPAEVKKINLTELAEKGDEAVEAVLKSYEDRQPVIMTGTLGSMKALTHGQLEDIAKQKRLRKLERETRLNMSSVKKPEDEDKEKELSSDDEEEETLEKHTDLAAMEAEYNEVCKMMDEGKVDECKKRLKTWMGRLQGTGAYALAEPTMHEQSSLQLKALAEDLAQLQAQFDEAIGLAEGLVAGS